MFIIYSRKRQSSSDGSKKSSKFMFKSHKNFIDIVAILVGGWITFKVIHFVITIIVVL